MDKFKEKTIKDYTAWDLNCPRLVNIKNRQKIESMFKRKARRKAKENLKKYLDF